MNNNNLRVLLQYLSTTTGEAAQSAMGLDEAGIPTARLSAMLRVIDDLQEITAGSWRAPREIETFDPSVSIRQIAELLSLTLPAERRHAIAVSESAGVQRLTQDRAAVEQCVVRLVSGIVELGLTASLWIQLSPPPAGTGLRITLRGTTVAFGSQAMEWLNATWDSACFTAPAMLPPQAGLMAAGKRLRGLGARLSTRNTAGHDELVLELPSVGPSHATADSSSRGLHILVAEDCDENYLVTETVLAGESMSRARNGREALDMVKQQRFDAVLMDVHMPVMDGYTAIYSIRQWETEEGRARTPIIILSSDDVDTQKRAAAEAGCSGFLRKPLCPEELAPVVDHIRAARQ